MAKVLINLDCSVRGLKANWEAGWAARLTGLRNAFSRKFEFGAAKFRGAAIFVEITAAVAQTGM